MAFNNVFVQLPMTHFFYRAHVFLHGPDTEESIRTLPSVGTVMWQARCIATTQPLNGICTALPRDPDKSNNIRAAAIG